MEKCKVLHILSTMNCGGIETFLVNIYRNMDREKISFDFLTLSTQENFFYEEEVKKLGGRVLRYNKKPTKFYNHVYNIVYALRHYGPYDAVHLHYTMFNGLGAMLARLCGVKNTISHAHIIAKEGSNAFQNFYNRFFKRLIPFFVRHKFACSPQAGRALYGADFQIINNGIDAEKFKFSPSKRQETRKSLGLENKFVLAHCGRIEKEKNHTFILDVFKELVLMEENSCLLLCGTGRLREAAEEKTKKLGLENKVKFLGTIKDVWNVLQAADVFIFPSSYEAFGIAALEAQASGLPCVMSLNVPQTARIVNTQALSLDEPPSLWAQKILELKDFEREDTSPQIKKSGFDIKQTVDILTEVYFRG